MTKFQYTYNSADIDGAYLTIDDIDIALFRRETGIEIDATDEDGESLGDLFITNSREA
jgi:hypothetical protein